MATNWWKRRLVRGSVVYFHKTLNAILASDVATRLYPHQKKALTFLLEREREKSDADGKFSSLWQPRFNLTTGVKSWYHIVTQQEVLEEPQEAKGAILADDVCHISPTVPVVFADHNRSLDGPRQNHNLCVPSCCNPVVITRLGRVSPPPVAPASSARRRRS